MTFNPNAAAKALGGNATQRKVLATCLGHRQTDCSPSIEIKTAASLRIVIQPTASGRKWIACLLNRVLCVSAWPFVKSARRLLAEGYPADTMVEVWRPNAAEWAMRGRLGPVAATVIDGESASRGAKNGPPARGPDQARGKEPPPGCARPRAVSGVDDHAVKRSKPSRRRTTARAARRKRLDQRRKTRPRRPSPETTDQLSRMRNQ
jgi:hypothetical protein